MSWDYLFADGFKQTDIVLSLSARVTVRRVHKAGVLLKKRSKFPDNAQPLSKELLLICSGGKLPRDQ